MSTIRICDYCGNSIDHNYMVHCEKFEDGKPVFKDYHIDCFNYKFSCDIRKIEE